MRSAVVISLKDLRERVRDKSVFIWALAAPLGLAYLFSVLFGNFGAESIDLRFGVVDRGGGELAAPFREQVLPGVEEAGFATVTSFDDAGAVRAAVAAGDLDAAFVVPQGFSQAVTSGSGATIEVLGNVDSDLGTSIARAIAQSYTEQLTASQVAAGLYATAGAPQDAAVAAQRVFEAGLPIELADQQAATRQLDATTYLAAGMGVFFLFFTVQYGIVDFLEERRKGTLRRLLAAPIPRAALYGSKVLTSFVLGIVSMAALIVATSWLMGADWGEPAGVALLVVAGVTAAVGIMAVVATFAKTAEQAAVWQSIIAVVLGMLGGTFFPIAEGRDLLATISLLTPHQWFLRGLGDLAGGGGIDVVLPAVGAMLAFAAVGFAVAAVRMRGEVAP